MIIGALRLPRPSAEAPGVYSALPGGAAQSENTGVRFRDVAGRFFPGTARNVRRNLLACTGRTRSKGRGENVPMKE